MNLHQIESVFLLTALSLTYSHSLRRVEKLRRAVALERVPDMLGVWTFAAVMLLPPPLIVVAVVAVNLGEWPSRKVYKGGQPFKYAVSTLGTSISCVVAGQALHHSPDYLNVPLAILTFCACNAGIVAALFCATGKRHILRMMADPRAHLTEFCTQALGAALGLSMHWHRPTAVIALPVLFTLHLSALRHTIKETDSFDTDTGLWTEGAWTVQAADIVAAGPHALVMVVDAPSSDRRMVADVIRGCVRDRDMFGTYDGDKIVIAAAFGAAVTGRLIAQRVRKSLHQSFSTFHMGYCSTGGEDLQTMLMAALTDLMFERDRSRSGNPR